MRTKHEYSPNHKVVTDSPHNYSEGGCMADGGLLDTVKGWFGVGPNPPEGTPDSKFRNPAASGNKEHPEEGTGGADRHRTIDKQIEDAGG
jgi:hypothetical protein